MTDQKPYQKKAGNIEQFNRGLDTLIAHSIANDTDPARMADVLAGHVRVLRLIDQYGGIRETTNAVQEGRFPSDDTDTE
jgi:hypothetical protein